MLGDPPVWAGIEPTLPPASQISDSEDDLSIHWSLCLTPPPPHWWFTCDIVSRADSPATGVVSRVVSLCHPHPSNTAGPRPPPTHAQFRGYCRRGRRRSRPIPMGIEGICVCQALEHSAFGGGGGHSVWGLRSGDFYDLLREFFGFLWCVALCCFGGWGQRCTAWRRCSAGVFRQKAECDVDDPRQREHLRHLRNQHTGQWATTPASWQDGAVLLGLGCCT